MPASALMSIVSKSTTRLSRHKPRSSAITSPDDERWTKPPDLTEYLDMAESPIGGGSFSDVYQGVLWRRVFASGTTVTEAVAIPVAVKVIRHLYCAASDPDIRKRSQRRLNHEILIWQALRHPNIVPLFGITRGASPFPALISPWAPGGTITSFFRQNPHLDRTNSLLGVARGLCYMHSQVPIILHGDLKADNIMIDGEGQPRLLDFGLSSVEEDVDFWRSMNTPEGSARWMSPELLLGTQECLTTKSDVYAFGITSWEIMTGVIPFREIPEPAVPFHVAIHHERPKRPSEPAVSDHLWTLWQRCWNVEQKERPHMDEVTRTLARMLKKRPESGISQLLEGMRSIHDSEMLAPKRSTRYSRSILNLAEILLTIADENQSATFDEQLAVTLGDTVVQLTLDAFLLVQKQSESFTLFHFEMLSGILVETAKYLYALVFSSESILNLGKTLLIPRKTPRSNTIWEIE
ncbi:kinase-like protein [Sistotremastrum niveocremeum HHB9708]|uniref:Kinase-like protein n=2 Tax=Sistotremastraceae TaxID=3402574 RepID=A0A164YWG5_9AGAM|nr:kinase-like protein [Sistotremastrum niveocremeum HHB9708]KZT36490.1 kinase-like protein [Sistotremastrum suecicum HHB10207 ss-3]